jgi:hypothetical protein
MMVSLPAAATAVTLTNAVAANKTNVTLNLSKSL